MSSSTTREVACGPVFRLDFSAIFRKRRGPLPPLAWTAVGAISIPLWATWPTLAVWSSAMPAFQVLTIAFAVGWLVLLPLERATSRNTLLPVLACALGLCGSNAFFIFATASIPAAQAKIISYLWPIMVVAGAASLRLFRLRPRHIVGLALGFTGTAILLTDLHGPKSWTGVTLALMGGASWAAYCVYRMKQGPVAASVLAKACGLATFICLGLHLAFETTRWPSAGALVAATAIGVVPLALGNLAWDEGVRRGDSRLLAVMAYLTPVVSTLILTWAGLATVTASLVAGGLIIATAGFVSGSEKP
jgi:drug/metabolite transporter (DMT)-like permease